MPNVFLKKSTNLNEWTKETDKNWNKTRWAKTMRQNVSFHQTYVTFIKCWDRGSSFVFKTSMKLSKGKLSSKKHVENFLCNMNTVTPVKYRLWKLQLTTAQLQSRNAAARELTSIFAISRRSVLTVTAASLFQQKKCNRRCTLDSKALDLCLDSEYLL